jgi:hypothetical protein
MNLKFIKIFVAIKILKKVMAKQKYNYDPDFLSGEISPIYARATESHLKKNIPKLNKNIWKNL